MLEKEQPKSQDPEVPADAEAGAARPLTDKERLQRLTPPLNPAGGGKDHQFERAAGAVCRQAGASFPLVSAGY